MAVNDQQQQQPPLVYAVTNGVFRDLVCGHSLMPGKTVDAASVTSSMFGTSFTVRPRPNCSGVHYHTSALVAYVQSGADQSRDLVRLVRLRIPSDAVTSASRGKNDADRMHTTSRAVVVDEVSDVALYNELLTGSTTFTYLTRDAPRRAYDITVWLHAGRRVREAVRDTVNDALLYDTILP